MISSYIAYNRKICLVIHISIVNVARCTSLSWFQSCAFDHITYYDSKRPHSCLDPFWKIEQSIIFCHNKQCGYENYEIFILFQTTPNHGCMLNSSKLMCTFHWRNLEWHCSHLCVQCFFEHDFWQGDLKTHGLNMSEHAGAVTVHQEVLGKNRSGEL